METAIRELSNSIQYYENQREKQIEFIRSDVFKNNTTGDPEDVVKHTNKIYDDYIAELRKAIAILIIHKG